MIVFQRREPLCSAKDGHCNLPGREGELMHCGTRGTHSSSRSFGRLGSTLWEGFCPVDLELSMLVVREEFECFPGKLQARGMALGNLEEKAAATVQVLFPPLQNHTLSQKVVHGIDGLEEERTLHEFIAPDTIPEDEKILPAHLPVLIFLKEEKSPCYILHHPAEGNVFYGIFRCPAEPTAGLLLKPPRCSPPIPPGREYGKRYSRRNRLISSLEDGDRSTSHRQLATLHFQPPEPRDKSSLDGRKKLVHQADHSSLDPIPGRSGTASTIGSLEDARLADTPLPVLILCLEDGLDDAL